MSKLCTTLTIYSDGSFTEVTQHYSDVGVGSLYTTSDAYDLVMSRVRNTLPSNYAEKTPLTLEELFYILGDAAGMV